MRYRVTIEEDGITTIRVVDRAGLTQILDDWVGADPTYGSTIMLEVVP